MTKIIVIEALIYIVALALLLSACDNERTKKFYVPYKVITSAAFLIFGIAAAFISNNSFIGKIFLIPFALCAVGDLWMALYNKSRKRRFVGLGIAFFMLAHMGFLTAYFMLDPSFSPWLIVFPLLCICLMGVIYKACHLHMGRIIYGGAVYCFFVSMMFAKACMMTFTNVKLFGLIGFAGLLFFLSDFSITFLYFYHFKKSTAKKAVHFFNLITYYVAMFLFVVVILCFPLQG